MAVKLVTFPLLTLTSSGVPYQASGQRLALTSLTLQAGATNTGDVYVGGEGVSTSTGMAIAPGDTCEITADLGGRFSEEFYADEVFIVTNTGGNTVRICGFTRKF